LIIQIILSEEKNFEMFSLCSFPKPTVNSSLFGPNLHLSSLTSDTLNLCSSLNVSDQVS
jgi:hypothetical protein